MSCTTGFSIAYAVGNIENEKVAYYFQSHQVSVSRSRQTLGGPHVRDVSVSTISIATQPNYHHYQNHQPPRNLFSHLFLHSPTLLAYPTGLITQPKSHPPALSILTVMGVTFDSYPIAARASINAQSSSV